MFDGDNLTAILVALIGTCVGFISFFSTAKAQKKAVKQQEEHQKAIDKLAIEKADDLALERAKRFYEDTLARMELHVKWLEDQLDETRAENRELRQQLREMRREIEELRSKALIVFREEKRIDGER